MTITVRDLIENLVKLSLKDDTNLDLPVYGTIGSSGVSYSVSTPSLDQVHKLDDGDLLELDEGTDFVNLYLGN
jgi:hypothetical protein